MKALIIAVILATAASCATTSRNIHTSTHHRHLHARPKLQDFTPIDIYRPSTVIYYTPAPSTPTPTPKKKEVF